MSHDEDTRRAYDAREAALHDEVTKILEAKEEVMIQNAKNFLIMGVSVAMVSQGTGLEIGVVETIKKSLNSSNAINH